MSPLALAVLLASAQATEVEVVPSRGALQAGLLTEVHVAVLDEGGRPLAEAPSVSASVGTWTPLAPGLQPGTWRFLADAPADVDEVDVVVAWPGGSARRPVPVARPEPSALRVRHQPRAGRELWFTVEGPDLPEPTALQVVSSEGRVVAVRARDGRLEVQLEPDDRPTARLVVVGVRDTRRDALPAWASLAMQATWEGPLDTAPGARVEVEVGGRRYGPWTAGASGRVTLTLDHLPDETSARLRLVDTAGNETLGRIPLATELVPRLVPFVTGPRYPGEAPPEVLLHAIRADGRPWSREGPSCRAPAHGDLPVVRVGAGTWRLRLPADLPLDAWEVRVRCTLGDEAERSFAVPLAEGVPVGLTVRVWPDVLSTDFPVADVQASLVNGAGERIAAAGRFGARADLGFVDLLPRGASVRGEYRADLAAEVGEDALTVTWNAPVGGGPVDRVEAVGEALPAGALRVHVRPLDPLRRPLAGLPVEVVEQGRRHDVLTDAAGWAAVDLPALDDRVRAVEVRAGGRQRRLVVSSVPGATRGPGRPDLSAVVPIQVDPGRVAEIAIDVDPEVVRPRRSALLRVRLLDRAGGTANAGEPALEVDQGTVRREGRSPRDEAWEWTYLPPPGFRPRTISVRARSTELDVEARHTFTVRPDPVDRWVGLSTGVQTDFGRVVSPFVAVDLAWRVRLGPRDQQLPAGRTRLFVRAGAGWYGAQAAFDVQPGVEGRTRMDLVPVHLGVALRQEYPTQAWWVSLGGMVAPFVGANAYNDVVVTRRVGVLPPGLHATLGYGLRVPGGEVAFELRGTVLNSPGSDIAFPGQIGGLAGTVGYRVFY